MTWREWHYYSEGLRKKNLKQWEHTRAINWMLYKANTPKGQQAKNIQEFWPLPTDVRSKKRAVNKGKEMSEADVAEFVKRMR